MTRGKNLKMESVEAGIYEGTAEEDVEAEGGLPEDEEFDPEDEEF